MAEDFAFTNLKHKP